MLYVINSCCCSITKFKIGITFILHMKKVKQETLNNLLWAIQLVSGYPSLNPDMCSFRGGIFNYYIASCWGEMYTTLYPTESRGKWVFL